MDYEFLNIKNNVSIDAFNVIDIRVGTIIAVHDFPKAKKPAYKLTIDFGMLGVKMSSAQITTRYSKSELLDRQIVAVVNFPKKQIANFMSACLVLGAVNETDVIVLQPSCNVKNGSSLRLF